MNEWESPAIFWFYFWFHGLGFGAITWGAAQLFNSRHWSKWLN